MPTENAIKTKACRAESCGFLKSLIPSRRDNEVPTWTELSMQAIAQET